MIRFPLRFGFQACLLFLTAIALCLSPLAVAQDITASLQDGGVETTAAVTANTNSTQIDTYAYAVITDYTLWEEGYWVAVEGDLSDNGSWVDSNYQDDGFTSAMTSLSDPINLGDVYGILATSGVCWWEDDGDGLGYENCDYPWTEVYLYGTLGVPSISSISPNGGTMGTSGTITVQGENLVDPFTGNASAAITGSGVTLTANSNPTDTSVGLNFSIASNATAGNQNLTLNNRFGTSNAETFTVGYPPAVVNNISPSVWTAGQSTSVTITGQNFGTAPTLSVNAAGVSLSLNSASPDGKTIQATATVALTAPSESVTVSVQPGYAGQGFYCVCNGQPPNGTDTATVQPVTPTPQINFNGSNISGTTQSVMAGQQIALSVPTPSGYSIQSQSWSFSNQSAITGGFTNTAGTGQPSPTGGGQEAADPDLTQNSLTFYWVNPRDNGETVTYTYTLNNGQSASTTATFNIDGPTVNLIATMPTDGSGVQIYDLNSYKWLGLTGVTGKQNTTTGIHFASNGAMIPGGTNGLFTWVQLISNSQDEYLNSSGNTLEAATMGLDTNFPYDLDDITDDRPSIQLLNEGEAWRTFTATMYLMWDPGLPSGCHVAYNDLVLDPTTGGYKGTSHPSTCLSIPIPLSAVTWHWSGCAINTLSQQTDSDGSTSTWLRSTSNGCPKQTLGTPVPAQFPTWTTLGN